MNRIRVFIVDDSPTYRAIIKAVLRRDPTIEIVGEAGDAYEAREAIRALSPDVITLDVEMPRMSGLRFLELIMRLRPTPVILISNLTQKGTATSIDALSLGAVECIGKPTNDHLNALSGLAEKIKSAAQANPQSWLQENTSIARLSGYVANDRVLAIGASTGGVGALLTILSEFPAQCPPTLITQHMPGHFIERFAQRLNELCAPEISEAQNGAPLLPGHIYIAPGGNSHLEVSGSFRPVCRLVEDRQGLGNIPSVNVMFESVANFADRAVGLILTGMGRDGADGLLAIRNAGGYTIGQDESTSVIYGMPRAAHEIGAVETQLGLTHIASAILTLCQIEKRKHVV